MIENVGGKNIAIQNKNTSCAKALAGGAIASSRGEPAGHDEAKTDGGADHHPHSGSDEVVLEGVLHEKHDPEEKNKAADPREEFDSKKCFPIDRGPSGGRWRWRFHWRLPNWLLGQGGFWN